MTTEHCQQARGPPHGRGEFTTAISQLVRSSFSDGPWPLRLRYSGNLWIRTRDAEIGRAREYSQVGFELLGVSTAKADAEVVTLALEGLRAVGLENAAVELRHPGFVRSILEAAALEETKIEGETLELVRHAIDRKDAPGLRALLEPLDLLREISAWFQPRLLSGTHVLITAGPTFEPIDPVRGLTNRSSGKMGYAVARAAIEAGARVTLVSGPTAIEPPPAARAIRVETAREMLDAVNANVKDADIFIAVAAVADYYVANNSAQKIKKEGGVPALELALNPDIVESVAKRPNPPFCVGFAAESEKLEVNAEAKRRRKKLPLLAANLVQSAIDADDNELVLFDDEGSHRLGRTSKLDQARMLIRHVAKLYQPRKSAIPV